MDQASALATGSACAVQLEFDLVVSSSSRPINNNTTSYAFSALADATTSSLFAELIRRGDGLLHHGVEEALHDLVDCMVAMAEGTAEPKFFLSSLDPGIGKTTTLSHFVPTLIGSPQHQGVAAILCFSRCEEIVRVVGEMNLQQADFAVLTSDEEVNKLSATEPNDARVLFTTHAMVISRCRGRSFQDVEVFHYRGEPRAVRVWDEAMLPGEGVALNTDQLASLRDPLRTRHPALAEVVDRLELEIKASGGQGSLAWPDVAAVSGVSRRAAKQDQERSAATYLDQLYDLAGRRVALRKHNNSATVISALDTRDAIPEDLAPVVIMDASGRVRATYRQWGRATGKLQHLRSAVRDYKNLKVHLMDKGAGKTQWSQNGDALALEVAHLIDTKPHEDWLVIYHKGVNGGSIPDQIRGHLSSDHSRVNFLHWGKHLGTNEYRQIKNVVIAGMNNHPVTDYEMKARYYSGRDVEQPVPRSLVQEIEDGEQMHHLLQAVSRSSVRQGKGVECGFCDAYIIAPKRSRLRQLIPKVFPGCALTTWEPTRRKPSGKVCDALLYVEEFFDKTPDGILPFIDLKAHLGINDASNFRKTIRNHPCFRAGLADLGIEEVTISGSRYRNALARKKAPFGPVEGACYVADLLA